MHGTLEQKSLVFEFDSVHQRMLWRAHQPASRPHDAASLRRLTEQFSGLLRVSDMLTDEILVTDAQLLDGALFLHHGPVGVRKLMARSPAELPGMVVLGRHENLAQCLRLMMLGSNPESGILATFASSALSAFGEDAAKLTEALKGRSNQRIRECSVAEIARVVAAELEGALVGNNQVTEPSGVFAELARQWEAWFEAAAANLYEVRPWPAEEFGIDESLAERDLPGDILRLGQEDEALKATLDWLKITKGRSTVMAYLNDPENQLSQRAVEQLREWWNSAYFDAMARQHNCSWLRLTADSAEAAIQETGGGTGRKPIQFKGELMKILSAMPPGVYASARYAARTASDRWRTKATQRHSDGLAYAISKFNEPTDREAARTSLVKNVGLIFAAAILGGLAGIFFSSSAGWATVVGLAVMVLLATPLAELSELHSMRTTKMKAFINIPGAVRG